MKGLISVLMHLDGKQCKPASLLVGARELPQGNKDAARAEPTKAKRGVQSASHVGFEQQGERN